MRKLLLALALTSAFSHAYAAKKKAPASPCGPPTAEVGDPLAALVGKSPAILKVKEQVRLFGADANIRILIRGESGTGKEVVAEAIHRVSPRRAQPFVPINCGAIAPHLLDAELFGHASGGAFTGADKKGRIGLVQVADGGTLFLDEFSSLPIPAQLALGPFLDTGVIRPLGGTDSYPTNVRVIAAINPTLQHELSPKILLLVNAVVIDLPPLREITDDLPAIAKKLLRDLVAKGKSGLHLLEISTPTMEMLQAYHWPGNVRELRGVLESALILANADGSETIRPHHLKREVAAAQIEENIGRTGPVREIDPESFMRWLRSSFPHFEENLPPEIPSWAPTREEVLQAYWDCKSVTPTVAKRLGLTKAQLTEITELYKITAKERVEGNPTFKKRKS